MFTLYSAVRGRRSATRIGMLVCCKIDSFYGTYNRLVMYWASDGTGNVITLPESQSHSGFARAAA